MAQARGRVDSFVLQVVAHTGSWKEGGKVQAQYSIYPSQAESAEGAQSKRAFRFLKLSPTGIIGDRNGACLRHSVFWCVTKAQLFNNLIF